MTLPMDDKKIRGIDRRPGAGGERTERIEIPMAGTRASLDNTENPERFCCPLSACLKPLYRNAFRSVRVA